MSSVPAAPTPPSSTLDRILMILNIALGVIPSFIPGAKVAIGIAQAAEQIALHASAIYTQETGQPIDLTKVPSETPIP